VAGTVVCETSAASHNFNPDSSVLQYTNLLHDFVYCRLSKEIAPYGYLPIQQIFEGNRMLTNINVMS
jgi:hypothetical protein